MIYHQKIDSKLNGGIFLLFALSLTGYEDIYWSYFYFQIKRLAMAIDGSNLKLWPLRW